MGAKRAPGWERVRKAHLFIYPRCSVCGGTKNLEVHHIIPFYINPDFELNALNLITLCRPHHFTFGHFENWLAYNPVVTDDAFYFSERMKAAKEAIAPPA